MTDRERAAKVDEYGELARQVDVHKPVAARAKELREEIQLWAAGEPAESGITYKGKVYELQVGPKANERTITRMDKLYALLGVKRFLSFCKIALADVDKEVPKEQHATFLTEERTGNRKLTPVLMRSPVQKRAA